MAFVFVGYPMRSLDEELPAAIRSLNFEEIVMGTTVPPYVLTYFSGDTLIANCLIEETAQWHKQRYHR